MDVKYTSPYNTTSTKYTGPYAIVSWDGGRNAENAMEGFGNIIFANGNTYCGTVQNDMLHGEGTLTDSENGTVFIGVFVEDKRQGQAKFTHPLGAYEGEYFDNKCHGKGKETDIHGNTFEGEYEFGDAVRGKMVYSNGEIYVGEMQDGDRHGEGKYWTDDGELLEGLFSHDEYLGPK